MKTVIALSARDRAALFSATARTLERFRFSVSH
jgi:hypothetical protein